MNSWEIRQSRKRKCLLNAFGFDQTINNHLRRVKTGFLWFSRLITVTVRVLIEILVKNIGDFHDFLAKSIFFKASLQKVTPNINYNEISSGKMNKKEKSLPKIFFEQFSNVDHFEKEEKCHRKEDVFTSHTFQFSHKKKSLRNRHCKLLFIVRICDNSCLLSKETFLNQSKTLLGQSKHVFLYQFRRYHPIYKTASYHSSETQHRANFMPNTIN